MPSVTFPSNVTLYPADVEKHLQAAYELINEAYMVECGSTGVAFKLDSARRYDTVDQARPYVQKVENEHEMYVVMDDTTGVMVGCIYVAYLYEAQEGQSALIKRLYFGPLASRQRGIGKLLVQYAEELAREQGCVSVDINVINVRSDVIPWYQRLGYQVVDTKPYPRPESCTREVHFLYMRKML